LATHKKLLGMARLLARQADKLAFHDYQIEMLPTLVVAGSYKITPVNNNSDGLSRAVNVCWEVVVTGYLHRSESRRNPRRCMANRLGSAETRLGKWFITQTKDTRNYSIEGLWDLNRPGSPPKPLPVYVIIFELNLKGFTKGQDRA
jgi:hypothetical protein